METNAMTGTNKLANRILGDAQADVEKTLAEAKGSVAAIESESETRIRELSRTYAQRREAAVQSILDGCRTRASIDGKKAALAKRREVIEKVFSAAYEAMLRLGEAETSAILSRVLDAEAEGGETIVPSRRDRAVLCDLAEKRGEKKLTLAETDADIDGGFLLIGDGYEKNCSLTAILAEIRTEEETNVAKLLFN